MHRVVALIAGGRETVGERFHADSLVRGTEAVYRELIEGAAFLPPEFFKHLDPASGNYQWIAHGSCTVAWQALPS